VTRSRPPAESESESAPAAPLPPSKVTTWIESLDVPPVVHERPFLPDGD
jgi:hypothetical protein